MKKKTDKTKFDKIVFYKNKINGEVYPTYSYHNTRWINGKEFMPVFLSGKFDQEPKLVSVDSLEKMDG